uniref:Uncharacterized protein LOC114327691 n=1 Tax=Diabrotica virgifera virgifera TaxID=50390 RepID=A0A6P7FG07_DIAVI
MNEDRNRDNQNRNTTRSNQENRNNGRQNGQEYRETRNRSDRPRENRREAIYYTVYINELSAPYRENSSLLFDLNEKISSNLISLEESIKNGLDFEASKKRGKPIVRSGLDEDLDEKKLRRQGIMNDVMAAARFAADNLPDFLDECSVVYLPEMGHLLAIKEWKPDCQPEDLQNLGFQFVFKLGGKFHYKNAMCVGKNTITITKNV